MAYKRSAQCILLAMQRSTQYLPMAFLVIMIPLFALLLPSTARIVLPFLHHFLAVLAPRLWKDILSWLTPPCLLFLLNFIIMTLAINSGILRTSGAVGSEFYAEVMVNLESRKRKHQFMEPTTMIHEQQQQQSVEHPSTMVLMNEEETKDLTEIEEPSTGTEVARQQQEELQEAYEEDRSNLKRIRRSESRELEENTCSSSSCLLVMDVPPAGAGATGAADKLSDEELRRRIDDFIARFQAQIRRESLSNYE